MTDDLWFIDADHGQISQVIHNLMINADQAMEKGGVIDIEAKNYSVETQDELPLNNGPYVKISIKDHGIGME